MKFTDRLKALGFTSYEAYLASPHWQSFKCRYRESGRPLLCAVCSQKPVQLHHHTYIRLGQEHLEDVTPLCRPCHKDVHALLREQGLFVEHTHRAILTLVARRGGRPIPVTPAAPVSPRPAKSKAKKGKKDQPKKKTLTRKQRYRARVKANKIKRREKAREEKRKKRALNPPAPTPPAKPKPPPPPPMQEPVKLAPVLRQHCQAAPPPPDEERQRNREVMKRLGIKVPKSPYN